MDSIPWDENHQQFSPPFGRIVLDVFPTTELTQIKVHVNHGGLNHGSHLLLKNHLYLWTPPNPWKNLSGFWLQIHVEIVGSHGRWWWWVSKSFAKSFTLEVHPWPAFFMAWWEPVTCHHPKGSLPAFFVGSNSFKGLPWFTLGEMDGIGWSYLSKHSLKTNLKFSEQHMLSLQDIFVQKYSIKNDWTLFNLQPPTTNKDSKKTQG